MTEASKAYLALVAKWEVADKPDELLRELDKAWFALSDEERTDVDLALAARTGTHA